MAGEGDAERLVVLLEARIRDFEKQMQKAGDTAGKSFKRTQDQSKKASKAVEDDWNRTAREFSRVMSTMGGPLGSMAGRFAALNEAGSKTGLILGGTAAGLAVVAAAATKAVVAYSAYEDAQARALNLLRATGGRSGQNLISLDTQTRGLGAAGTQNLTDIRAAEAELLRYRDVAGSVFGDALKMSQNLAALGFVNLTQATSAFGRALSNPIEGLQGLRDAGLRYTPVQEKLIDDLFKAGRVLEAQNLILKIAAEQIGGANTRAADTLSGAYGRLTNAGVQFLEQQGKEVAELLKLKAALDLIAGALDSVNQKKGSAYNFSNFLIGAASPLTSWTTAVLNPLHTIGAMGTAVADRLAPDMGAFAQAVRAAGDYGSALDALALKRERLLRARDLAAAASRDPFDAHAIEARRLTAEIEKVDEAYKRLGNTQQQVTRQVPRITVRPMRSEAQADLPDATRQAVEATNVALDKQIKLLSMSDAERAKWEARDRALVQTEDKFTVAVSQAADGINRRVNAMMAAGAMKGFNDSARMTIAAMQIEAQTFGMSESAAAAYRMEMQFLAQEQIKGVQLSPGMIAGVEAQASAFEEASRRVELLRDATSSVSGFSADLRMQLQQGANAWTAFGNAGLNALTRLSDKLLDKALQQLLGGILTGVFGGTSRAGSGSFNPFGLYDTGGYTGPGGRYQPAGIVHRGEVVWSQSDIARAGGVANVEALRRGARGFANGGYAGPSVAATSSPSRAPAPVVVQHTIQNHAPVDVSQKTSDDGLHIETLIRPLEHVLADRMMRGRGPLALATRSVGTNNHLR